jgi:predicted enzyme related to lactoylglutathione lyase
MSGSLVHFGHVGWFAHCTDTEGNAFSIFQSDETVSA